MNEITGRLEGWHVTSTLGFLMLRGIIYGDTKGRFPDGDMITTSIIDHRPIKQGDIVPTCNSAYLLGKPAKAN